ncbi:MAG: helix-turn-helix domain-containing protein [Candidatus Borkfalkia sp.]
MKNKFGERLSILLTEKNISYREFAQRLDISPSIVSQWTRGLKQPTADNILLVAEFFDVSTDYILGKTE